MPTFSRCARLTTVLFASALLACSGSDQPGAEPPAPSGDLPGGDPSGGGGARNADGGSKPDAAPPLPPVPALAFAFDDADGKLHVRVPADTARDAVVVARLRRAAPGPSTEVDCAKLRGTSISLSAAKPIERALDAVGPKVDASMLESAYSASSRPTPSRSLVDGCLFDAKGAVLARVSMSLMKAWDLGAKATGAAAKLHGVQAYAEACEAELGDLSVFKGGVLDCVGDPAMAIVPITVSNPASPDQVVTRLDGTTTTWPLRGAQLAATTRCDRPAWLDYADSGSSQCSPFSRIGASVNAKGTRIVVACRRYSARSRDDAAFDDINLIAHNPTSGKTCFFNSRLESVQDARKVPSPTAADADAFWMDVRDVATVECTHCHDADPWIHSPWIDQLKDAGGHALVPKIGEDSAYSIATKYSIFARESFLLTDRNGQARTWEQPQHLVDAGKCGSCHRIGSKAGLGEWTSRAVAHSSSATWFQTWVSDAYRTASKVRWMSPNASGATQDDVLAAQAILACGSGGRGCALADTPH